MSVLVVSFDGYSDLWRPFFRCFSTHWPDCPYPVLLGCGRKRLDLPGVEQIFIGDDVDYSSNLLAMITKVGTPWVIVWTDDFFPSQPINTPALLKLHKQLDQCRDAVYLDLLRFPTRIAPLFAVETNFPGIAEMPKGAPYRTSLGVTLWRKEFLEQFLTKGASAWDIERLGGGKADNTTAKFLCLSPRFPITPIAIVNVIERRALTWRGRKLLKNLGEEGSFRSWRRESPSHYLRMAIYSRVRHLVVKVAVLLLGQAKASRLFSMIVSTRTFSVQN